MGKLIVVNIFKNAFKKKNLSTAFLCSQLIVTTFLLIRFVAVGTIVKELVSLTSIIASLLLSRWIYYHDNGKRITFMGQILMNIIISNLLIVELTILLHLIGLFYKIGYFLNLVLFIYFTVFVLDLVCSFITRLLKLIGCHIHWT